MNEKIIEILNKYETPSSNNEFDFIHRWNYSNLANELLEAINNTLCCTELVCDLCKGSGWNDRYTTPEECHICQGTGKAN